jgi:S-adenosylmethionine hydrolase
LVSLAGMARPRLVTLYSDFGHRDVYAGVLRAVLTTMAPEAEVVDMCHGIPPGDLHSAAFQLLAAVPHVPKGTIHLCVVDPGVGTDRRVLAVRAGGHTFVAPDNGVLSPVVEALGGATEIRFLTNEKLQRQRRSATFEGRDVMAPVVAHLVRGIHFALVGDEGHEVAELPGFAPDVQADAITGRVIHVDHFGNLITNLLPSELDGGAREWTVSVDGRVIEQWGRTFADVARGSLLVYTGSTGFLEVAARDGSAATVLGVQAGVQTGMQAGVPVVARRNGESTA